MNRFSHIIHPTSQQNTVLQEVKRGLQKAHYVSFPVWAANFTLKNIIKNKWKYLLSPYVDQMQIVKTDSIRPQNKVGLPIGVSDLMFLNIIRLSKTSRKNKIKLKKTRQG